MSGSELVYTLGFGDRVPMEEHAVRRFLACMQRVIVDNIEELQELLAKVEAAERSRETCSPFRLQNMALELASIDCRDQGIELLGHGAGEPDWWPVGVEWCES